MEGVLESVNKVQRGEDHLIVSSIFRSEVLEASLPSGAIALLDRLFLRRNVSSIPVDDRVAKLAGEIRSFYIEQNKSDHLGMLQRNDAIHLATALHVRAAAFYTFDDGRSSNSRSLLSLNGNVAGHHLIVCKPPVTQFQLFPAGV